MDFGGKRVKSENIFFKQKKTGYLIMLIHLTTWKRNGQLSLMKQREVSRRCERQVKSMAFWHILSPWYFVCNKVLNSFLWACLLNASWRFLLRIRIKVKYGWFSYRVFWFFIGFPCVFILGNVKVIWFHPYHFHKGI